MCRGAENAEHMLGRIDIFDMERVDRGRSIDVSGKALHWTVNLKKKERKGRKLTEGNTEIAICSATTTLRLSWSHRYTTRLRRNNCHRT